MIDLHIHTNNSDGSDSVLDVLEKAEQLKLTHISITDHDNSDAYDILKKINSKKYFSGKIIKGIELKCAYKGRLIDVLGYNYNIRKMKKLLKKYYPEHSVLQEKYLKHFYKACENMNLKLTPFERLNWNKEKDWATLLIYKEIKKFPENEKKCPNDLWESLDNFRYNYLYNKQTDFYIDKTKDYPNLEECINIIHKAGGLAFMAHIFIYDWAKNKKEFINEIINNYEIDGFECIYTKFSNEQSEYISNICDYKGLYKSGGSDYHGINKPGIELGVGFGNLAIPANIIKNWNTEHHKWYEKLFGKKLLLLDIGNV